VTEQEECHALIQEGKKEGCSLLKNSAIWANFSNENRNGKRYIKDPGLLVLKDVVLQKG